MADVLVLGGGPSGCTFAARMSMLGHRVTLVERAVFPRPHIGESLSPGVPALLASIGADDILERAGGRRVDAVRTLWEGPATIRADPRAEGMIVDRGRFDALLLAHARKLGVRILQPARVTHLDHGNGWQARIACASDSAGSIDVRADFLAHATGRGHGGRSAGVRTIALFGWWRGHGLSPMPQIIAGQRGWFWGVPLPDGHSNLLAFLDPGAFRALPGATLQDRYRWLIAESGLIDDGAQAEPTGPAAAVDATPLLHPDPVSASHIRLGDAALALDPLSSSGVQKAIQNALSGAVVANTLLRGGDRQAAVAFHQSGLSEAATSHAGWAAGHYARAAASRPDRFWAERSIGSTAEPEAAPAPAPAAAAAALAADRPMALSPDARLIAVPCLGETLVACRPALSHPRLSRPVAYLGETELAPLIGSVRQGQTLGEIATGWSRQLPMARSLAIAGWLVNHGILTAATAPTGPLDSGPGCGCGSPIGRAARQPAEGAG